MGIGTAAIEAGKAYVRLYTDSSEYVKGLRSAERKLNAFARNVGNIGRRMAAIASIATVAIAFSARTFADFQDQMLSVQAVSKATRAEFAKLYDQAKELGASTSFTASDVAGGQVNLARAGFNPAEIEAAIPSVLALARATGTELAQAAEIAAGTLRAFNLDASETGHVSDVMVATANNSAQTLEELGESMKYAAPIAAEYGMSLGQTSKALGVMANMQIKGSMAGTSLRQIMLRLADTGVQEQLHKIGVEAVDSTGNLRPLGDVMIELGKAMAGMGQAERISLAKDLFDQRAVGGALKLAQNDFPALAAAIENADGIAQETAETMDSGLGGAFRKLMSAVEAVKIAIGEALAGELTEWMESIQGYAAETAEWVKNNQGVVTTILELTAVVGTAAAAIIGIGATISGIATIAGAASTAVTALSGAFALLAAHPVIAAMAGVALAIAGVTAAVADLSGEIEGVGNLAANTAVKNNKRRMDDRAKFNRLEELSGKSGPLSKDERAEAASAVVGLESQYGSLGLSFGRDENGQFFIRGVEEARKQLDSRQRAEAVGDLKEAIAEEQRNMEYVAGQMADVPERSEEMDKLFAQYKARETRLERLKNRLASLQGKTPDDVHIPAGSGLEGLDETFKGAKDLRYRGSVTDASNTPKVDAAEAARMAEDAAQKLRDAKIAAEEDAHKRAIALINERYDKELERAKELPEVRKTLEEARNREIANADQEFAKQQEAEAERQKQRELRLQDELDREKIIANTKPGLERDKALLEEERRDALRDAQASGLDPKMINELYDLKKQQLEMEAGAASFAKTPSPTSTFSAAAAFQMGLGGKKKTAADKTAENTEKLAKNSDKQLDETKKTREAVERGGRMGK